MENDRDSLIDLTVSLPAYTRANRALSDRLSDHAARLPVRPGGGGAASVQCTAMNNGIDCGTCAFCSNGACITCPLVNCVNGVCSTNACFVAGTQVAMTDGMSTPIELGAERDRVVGDAGVNTVLAVRHPTLGDRPLYALNDTAPFVTASHHFLTGDGWKAVDGDHTCLANDVVVHNKFIGSDSRIQLD